MLREAGFERLNGREEAIYAGPLTFLEAVMEPPIPGMTLQRKVGGEATRFTAIVEGMEIGHGDCVEELTLGGTLPALRGWAELTELWIEPAWRDRGVGSWIVSHIVDWLLFARCDRIVLFVDADDEAAGAGRFYNRWGWTPFARRTIGWKLPPEQLPGREPT
jgi:GNAT superfamily N-acetyltransferase